MIDRNSSLRDVAFEICSALDAAGLRVVLVGGSAATFYAPSAYQSMDLDFTARFAVDANTEARLVEIVTSLGYSLSGNTFINVNDNPFTVEFPKGPASVGDEVLQEFNTIRNGKQVLVIVQPTDCIRDRLLHYFYWNDRTALSAALGVAESQRAHIRFDLIRQWAAQVADEARIEYPDIPLKMQRFLARLAKGD